MKYDKNFGDVRNCQCGHSYYRHFDTYDAMAHIGCKYCECFDFVEKVQESKVKETNPKDAVGTGKIPFSTIPAAVIAELGLAMLEGARKYGRHNYRVAGVRASVYYDACMRHLTAFWEGEDIDPDSGLPHIIKAIACLIVLRDSQIQENWVDDRPPVTPVNWQKKLNDKAKEILEKYPNALPAYIASDTKL